jgi:thiamine-phosphate pyrophosphorylase
MTDERLGHALPAAVECLPEGAGIVFRHYRTERGERRRVFDLVRARRADVMLLLGGRDDDARAWGADGSHGPGPGAGLRTAPVHDFRELREAQDAGAAAVFVSPVFATRSHPGAAVLGEEGFAALAAEARVPVIALGGMDAARFASLRGAYGWAGIDAWLKQARGKGA